MKYMLLIASAPGTEPAPESPEGQAEFGAWLTYTQELEQAGVLVAGDPLLGPATAKTVRGRAAEQVVSDGPFAETKEALGGFYVVDVPDEATALEWAGRMPNLDYGCVEVRPVMEFPDP